MFVERFKIRGNATQELEQFRASAAEEIASVKQTCADRDALIAHLRADLASTRGAQQVPRGSISQPGDMAQVHGLQRELAAAKRGCAKSEALIAHLRTEASS